MDANVAPIRASDNLDALQNFCANSQECFRINSLLVLGLGCLVSCAFDKVGCGVRYNALVNSEKNTFKAAPTKDRIAYSDYED